LPQGWWVTLSNLLHNSPSIRDVLNTKAIDNLLNSIQTGYVGGDVLHALLQTHPSWESNITCLVRSQSRAASLSAAYPSIKLVFGTLEDTSILEDEAAKAEIVLHWASSDHIGAAAAIKNGLESGRGGYWIHTSGTDILLHPKLLEGRREIEDDVSTTGVKLYDDWDGIKEVVSIPGEHLLYLYLQPLWFDH
jgi:hypothetical protein